jgi:hypothetical protein
LRNRNGQISTRRFDTGGSLGDTLAAGIQQGCGIATGIASARFELGQCRPATFHDCSRVNAL